MSVNRQRCGMGLFFYPRGGSAKVARYLSRALARQGWDVTLASGSLGPSGALGDALTAFAGLDVVPARYDDAVESWTHGADPMDAPFPMHPSYEARRGVPDRAFPWVSPGQAAHMGAAWATVLGRSERLSQAKLLHLHHLTPLHDAAALALPGIPVVTHLHGTELKMLDGIARSRPGLMGPHARWWASRMRAAAHRAVCTIAISPHDAAEAVRLLGLDPTTVHCIANGVDVDLFTPRLLRADEKREHWVRWLCREPRGWDEASGVPGSVRYGEREVVDAFFDRTSGAPLPVLLFVGRFLDFKRVPLLIRAYARARERMSVPAPLVIWGGVPGEWEGAHPHTVATEGGVEDVFLTGWRDHDELPLGLACADCFVAPSTDEPFGLVYLEAMSAGVPVIGTRSGGPPSFVNVVAGEPDGWLVEPDDEAALADAIVVAVNDAAERSRRAANARRHARASHSWSGVGARVARLYAAIETTRSRPAA